MLTTRPNFIMFVNNMIYGYNEYLDSYHYVKDQTVVTTPSRIREDRIKKSSKTMLELVEAGDIIDVLLTNNYTYQKMEVISIDENVVVTPFLTIAKFEFTGFKNSRSEAHELIPFCRGFYKLQSNGDFDFYDLNKVPDEVKQ